jgi:ribosomal protein L19
MVPGGIGFPMLQPGDVVSVSYKSGDGMPYTFTGILLALKRKKMMSPNSSITIRNIFDKVPIETQIAVYAAPMLRIRVMDQMRKAPKYRPAKLYYLRERLQRESIIVT